jgi:general stress protein 26
MVIYLETGSASRKIEQLGRNPQAQLVFSKPDYSEVATLSGRTEIVESLEVKKKIWDSVPSCADYYPSYDAPEFAVIKFVTESAEYLNPKLQLKPFEYRVKGVKKEKEETR